MQLVFFDLETSCFVGGVDVLQIGANFQNGSFNATTRFNVYMDPTRPITWHATQKNGLTFVNGQLYHKGSPVSTETRHNALLRLLTYLSQNGGHCVMIAHNCPLDRSYLLRMIREEGLINDFRQVIDGFTDTQEMLRKKYPGKDQKGQLTLEGLADELSLSTAGLHDAAYDALLLEKIALHHFTKSELIAKRVPFQQAVNLLR